jgi:hypothetical protein
MGARSGMRAAVAAAALALATAAPADALVTPDLVLALGRTTAVAGEPGGGGMSAAVSALWRLEGPLAGGLTVFADDMGTDLGRLRDANDGSDIGTIEEAHRFAYGAAWRLDAALPGRGGLEPYLTATWGAYRVQDDVRGEVRGALTSTGVGAGIGVRRHIARTGALGLCARWHEVLRGDAGRWLSVTADWQWHWGPRP